MNKLFLYGVVIIIFSSCRSYRMLEGRSKPVYFTPDSSVFEDTLFSEHEIYYSDMLNLRANFVHKVELEKGKTSKAIIYGPIFFNSRTNNDEALVYPGEHINVKGVYSDYTFTISNNHRRDKELMFFKAFHELEKRTVFQFVPNASLATILELESRRKAELVQVKISSYLLFDSLLRACHVSKKFKKLTKDYLENRYDFNLFYSVYRTYKDTLQAHGLYREKLKQFIPLFNNLSKRSKLNNVSLQLNDIVQELFPHKSHITSEAELWHVFDSVETNFTGLARDYLLSQLMYRAYTYGMEVPPAYFKKYKSYSKNKDYGKTVHNVMVERRRNDKRAADSCDPLLAIDGRKTSSLEKILAANKGKYVLVDFWASWCIPCREQRPYWEKLVQNYPKDKIVFLNVSMDREIQVWRKAVIAANAESNNHYLLINADQSPLVKQYDISAIPRYMLFDREGKIIDADVPRPSEPALSTLLDQLINAD
ncbi:MAG: TlpA family protein disulfide reductase [Flavisolibacter sp.]